MTHSLMLSVKGVTAVIALLLVAWWTYAIVGMQLFKGLLYSCSDPDFPEGAYRYGVYNSATEEWSSPPCSGTWVDPDTGLEETRDYEWSRGYFHFDNLFAAMWSLWLFMSMEDWVDLMWSIVDATKIDYQPKTNNNLWGFLFFFFGITIFGFYLINLSVGVIADTYVEISTRNQQGMEMQEDAYIFQETLKALREVSPIILPPYPQNPVRKLCYKVAFSKTFEWIVMGCLVVLAFVMSTAHYDQSDSFTTFQEEAEEVFTWLFTVEAIIKIIANTPLVYFSDGVYIFDFFVTVICVFDSILFDYILECGDSSSPLISFLRGLRVLRLFSLCLRIEGTRQVIKVATYPSKTLAIVFYIISVSIIIAASIGVACFHTYEFSDLYTMHYQNFTSLKSAIQLLYIVSTGEMWVDYMDNLQDMGAPAFGTGLYFFVFLIIEQFLLVNLFVVIVVNTYDILKERGRLEKQIQAFRLAYSKFDPQADKGVTKRHEIFEMLSTIPRPLGLSHPKPSPYVMIQWKTDFILKEKDYTGKFDKLILNFYALSLADLSLEGDEYTTRRIMLRAYSVSIIYRQLRRYVRRRRMMKRKTNMQASIQKGIAALLSTRNSKASEEASKGTLWDDDNKGTGSKHKKSPGRLSFEL
mmetsp:Transcript_34901/g.44517  ORF Transcript_34901/g.44517 Transcript_34901/m.44517 type:complete len:638 (-) Transcript_34901:342-2255(-)